MALTILEIVAYVVLSIPVVIGFIKIYKNKGDY